MFFLLNNVLEIELHSKLCVCVCEKQVLMKIKHGRTVKDLNSPQVSSTNVLRFKHLLMCFFFLNIIWCNGLLLCIPLSSSTPTQNDVISKLCTCAISLSIYLSLCKLLPVERCIEEDFVNSTPFYLQVIYLYVAMLALRPKYYFVWTFGELVIIANTSSLATPYKKSNLAV